jgi:hypothetical protein
MKKKKLAKVAIAAFLLASNLPAGGDAAPQPAEGAGTVLTAGCAASPRGCAAWGADQPSTSANPYGQPQQRGQTQQQTNPSNRARSNYNAYDPSTGSYNRPGSYETMGGSYSTPGYGVSTYPTAPGMSEMYPTNPHSGYNPNPSSNWDSPPRR